MKKLEIKIGNNCIFQIVDDNTSDLLPVGYVKKSWKNSFIFKKEENCSNGLRAAQLGAIYSIKAHWTVSNKPATIVMPTGTGKTETMIATVVSEGIDRTLIIVPSDLLRKQTADKFMKFGILQSIGVVSPNALSPSVACLKKTPKELTDLQNIINKSNIIVTTASLIRLFPDEYIRALADGCDALIVDEAHHIAAKSWAILKYELRKLRCLQFTATPFRNDGKKVDGDIIYNFPLSKAQEQGYFKPIIFKPIYEFDEVNGDFAIANAAVNQLEADLKEGYNHLILVRARDIKSAERLYETIYTTHFSKYKPVIIHSGISRSEKAVAMKSLNDGGSRIVVCVDMFGEGIDIPQLKIAAVHDKYKSLPITLQFIGRFARAKEKLGDATLITNIANDELSESLNELYAQDSDWNAMLNILSDKAINKEISLQNLAKGFDFSTIQGITIQQLRPKISMVAYKTYQSKWEPNKIYSIFDSDNCFVSINNEKNVLVIIEKENSKIEWTSFKGIFDTNWNLHIVYWNTSKKIVYVNSTKKSISKKIIDALFSKSSIISGEQVFRCLSGIKRLMLGTIGLKTVLDGPIRFRMFAGIDIGNGISESQKETSLKSNLFGVGYYGNGKMSIGCSYKGRIWSRWVESIDFWMNWCDEIALKLLNESIDTSKIFEGALIPIIINKRPDSIPYGIEWPIDMDLINDNSCLISDGKETYPIYETEINLKNNNLTGHIQFFIKNHNVYEEYELRINNGNFEFVLMKSGNLSIIRGKHESGLTEFFNEYPPVIKFADQSILEGNIQVDLSCAFNSFSLDRITQWVWDGVDIRKESQGKKKKSGTIQYYLIEQLKKGDSYSIIFDDDGAGEIADVIAIFDNDKEIDIQFYHCKYAHGEKPGARVADLYEVCAQAEKSVKWCQQPTRIIDRLIKREAARQKEGYSRFEVGSIRKLQEIKNKMRVYPVGIGMTIVQPGVDKHLLNADMLRIISGTASCLMDTYSVDLKIICS